MRFIAAAIFAATALLLSGCIVNGAEAPCRGSLATLTQAAANPSDGSVVTLEKLSAGDVAGLIDKFGPAPVAEYDAMYLVENGDYAALIIVKGDCIEFSGTPQSKEGWFKVLGRLPA